MTHLGTITGLARRGASQNDESGNVPFDMLLASCLRVTDSLVHRFSDSPFRRFPSAPQFAIRNSKFEIARPSVSPILRFSPAPLQLSSRHPSDWVGVS